MQLRIIVVIDQQQPKWRGPEGRERNFIRTLIIEVVAGEIKKKKIMVRNRYPSTFHFRKLMGIEVWKNLDKSKNTNIDTK